MMHRLLPVAGVLAMLVALIAPGSALAITFDQEPFHERWLHTDQPVAEGLVDRTWIWGPGPITAGMDEQYAESPNGMRRVQYFDKSRMEITYPDGDADELWYVTNGLLVMEMVTGRLQLGDNTFEDHQPALEKVAGDQVAGSDSPSYAAIQGLMGEEPFAEGSTITATADAQGNVSSNETYANAGVTAEWLVPETNHTVASVFWDFMNSTGLVADDGTTYQGRLFPNAFYATGLPITEAYWTTIPVGGEEKDVLFQCFERRCLTYTPTNEPGWQVEAGNVGQHYQQWRYGNPTTQDVTIFLIAIGDEGASGMEIGCGDSVVGITRTIPGSVDPITGALEELLSIPGPDFGESGLSTAFYAWDVTVDSVTVVDGEATVEMSGSIAIAGVCEGPRIEAQLEQTVLAVPDVDAVEFFINGESLDSILSLQ
ncbi:MAG: GerMN domain-containing protein [Thermomicrobiales bacterium]